MAMTSVIEVLKLSFPFQLSQYISLRKVRVIGMATFNVTYCSDAAEVVRLLLHQCTSPNGFFQQQHRYRYQDSSQ
jgi:hypothetical protein